MFVVCILDDFELEQSSKQLLRIPFPITVDKGKRIGFLPVYETREDALADYPDAKLLEIRLKTRGNKYGAR